ncbi:IclR family transcriptional regulator [Pigmentiphaga aceris]|nr:IclR family transcriptional regulator [Pigmentiphaga aceris]
MISPDTPKSDGSASATGTQALARGLRVLAAVAAGAKDLRSIGEAVGTSRATTHRLVSFLRQEGWLRQSDSKAYSLGPRMIELGAIALEQVPLATLARPHLLQLAQSSGNTIHLGMVDMGEVLYLDKIPGTVGQEMRSRIGHRMLLASTGVGKALMLDMSEADWRRHYDHAVAIVQSQTPVPPGILAWPDYRDRMRKSQVDGYAIDLEENEVGIRCVAAPIRDAAGHIVAAVSVAGTVPYMSMARMVELAAFVLACVHGISSELGWRGPATWPPSGHAVGRV